jgi:hypothetical protein
MGLVALVKHACNGRQDSSSAYGAPQNGKSMAKKALLASSLQSDYRQDAGLGG